MSEIGRNRCKMQLSLSSTKRTDNFVDAHFVISKQLFPGKQILISCNPEKPPLTYLIAANASSHDGRSGPVLVLSDRGSVGSES